jgi:alpha-beta hydrolase superfamily lysophospholipase
VPFFTVHQQPVYYRHWAVDNPKAAVVFLHGFGEHTDLYHRYGFALNAAGIDLWAVDQFGHGRSPGERGQFGTLEDSSALADGLTELVERQHPGLPVIAQGHSYGAVVTLFRLLEQPQRYRAGVISGAPLVAIRELVDLNTAMNLDTTGLSTDPFYLDSINNDPLGFNSADSRAMTRELDRAWDRFGAELPKLTVPTLAVHGAADPVAAPGAVRAYAEQIEPLEYREFARTRHDVLNDITHREVTAAIVDFIDRNMR